MPSQSSRALVRAARIRIGLLAVLMLGLVGTGTELILLQHYEEPWQYAPVVLIPAAIGVLIWHAAGRSATSRVTTKVLMVAFLIAGVLGIGLHFRGAAAFQRETNPSIGRWELVTRALKAKAPPVLAAGTMLELGLLGLLYLVFDGEGGIHA